MADRFTQEQVDNALTIFRMNSGYIANQPCDKQGIAHAIDYAASILDAQHAAEIKAKGDEIARLTAERDEVLRKVKWYETRVAELPFPACLLVFEANAAELSAASEPPLPHCHCNLELVVAGDSSPNSIDDTKSYECPVHKWNYLKATK